MIKVKGKRNMDMKRIMIIMVLGALVAHLIPAQAQTFQPATEKAAIQSQQMVNSGVQYKGTVYEPFSNTTPSEQSEVGASYSPAQAPDGPRRTLGHGTDPGSQSNDFPIGDAVLPLMAMAVVFGAIVALRRRRNTGIAE